MQNSSPIFSRLLAEKSKKTAFFSLEYGARDRIRTAQPFARLININNCIPAAASTNF